MNGSPTFKILLKFKEWKAPIQFKLLYVATGSQPKEIQVSQTMVSLELKSLQLFWIAWQLLIDIW